MSIILPAHISEHTKTNTHTRTHAHNHTHVQTCRHHVMSFIMLCDRQVDSRQHTVPALSLCFEPFFFPYWFCLQSTHSSWVSECSLTPSDISTAAAIIYCTECAYHKVARSNGQMLFVDCFLRIVDCFLRKWFRFFLHFTLRFSFSNCYKRHFKHNCLKATFYTSSWCLSKNIMYNLQVSIQPVGYQPQHYKQTQYFGPLDRFLSTCVTKTVAYESPLAWERKKNIPKEKKRKSFMWSFWAPLRNQAEHLLSMSLHTDTFFSGLVT